MNDTYHRLTRCPQHTRTAQPVSGQGVADTGVVPARALEVFGKHLTVVFLAHLAVKHCLVEMLKTSV